MKKWSAIIGVILILSGCVREKKKIVEVEKPVNAWVMGFITIYPWQYAYLISDPVEDPAKCDAILKWGQNQKIFEIKDKILTGIEFWDTLISCNPNTQYTLEINSQTFGKSSGNVIIPSGTQIVNPDWEDTLPIGNVQISWTTAQNATFYCLYISIDAYDETGEWIDDEYIDTFITSTSFTIPSSYFQVEGAAYYIVYCDVFPYSGKLYEANMSGNFKGYLFGEGEGDWIYFYVGTPVVSAPLKTHEKPTVEQRIHKLRDIVERLEEK